MYDTRRTVTWERYALALNGFHEHVLHSSRYLLIGLMSPFPRAGHIFILDHKSSGHVSHDLHKLQTKAINHSTRRYMIRRELQSDQPIHVLLLRVVRFPPSDVHCRHSRAARATPRKDTPAATVLSCAATRIY